MRILLDTNVLVAGLISEGGPPGQLLDAWLTDDRYQLVTSNQQLDELVRVLSYEKISSRLPHDRVRKLRRNMGVAMLVEPIAGVDASPDPDDNVILATAIAGNADLIVSGDKRDLLSLGEVEGIAIVTARAALERLNQRI